MRCPPRSRPLVVGLPERARLLRALALVSLVSAVAGCGRDRGEAGGASDASLLVPVANVQQLMLHVLEPAAQAYWDAVGWIVDSDGTHEIRPADEEEWEEVENAAWVLIESSNLLLMDGRRPDDGPWIGMSQALIEVSQRALSAAENRDEEAVFEMGGQVYHVCTGCHATYALETLRPSARVEP